MYGYQPQGFTSTDPVQGGVGGQLGAPGNYIIGYGGNYYTPGTGYSGPLFDYAQNRSTISAIEAWLSNTTFLIPNWVWVLVGLFAFLFVEHVS